MTDEERGEIVVTARLLTACTPMIWLAIALIGVAAFRLSHPLAVVSITAGLIALVYGIRSLFDGQLFEDVVEEKLTMQQLDAGLRLRNRGRSWSDRCRGARRLPVITASAILVQLIALVLAAA